MIRKIFFISFLLLLTGIKTYADDVKFTAYAKSPVQVGERFKLVFKINAEGQKFIPPALDDFRVLVGPSTSSFSNVSISNGKMAHNVEASYSYVLQATQEGDFTIAGAKINIGGTIYESNSVNIKVLAGDPTAIQSAQQTNQQAKPNTQKTQQPAQVNDPSVSNKDVFLRAYLSKTNATQGEPVFLTYKLFFKVNVSSIGEEKSPSYNGFWSYNLMKDAQNYPQYDQRVNNTMYRVAEINKVALYPQKSGKLTINPLEIKALIRVREKSKRPRDPFEAFFNDSFFGKYKTVEKSISSNPVTVNVQPLPAGKPSSFNGAVGKYSLKSEVTDTDIKTNDAINIKVTISGKGNLKLIEPLKFNFPPDFEVYDPKIIDNISVNSGGVSGSRTFEYLVIPRSAGDFVIEPAKFSYFDLAKNKYVTHATPAYEFNIEKGAGDSGNVTYSANNKEDIRHIGSDIRFIEKKPFNLSKVGHYFLGSTLFFILLAAPFILFFLFVIIWRNKLKQNRNIALMKNKKATKVARKKLQLANKFLKENNKNAFYDEISKALWGYLGDKLNIQTAELTKDNVQETFIENNIEPELASKMIEVIDNSEFARFAPGDATTQMDNIYNDSISIIMSLEKEIDKKLSKKALSNNK